MFMLPCLLSFVKGKATLIKGNTWVHCSEKHIEWLMEKTRGMAVPMVAAAEAWGDNADDCTGSADINLPFRCRRRMA